MERRKTQGFNAEFNAKAVRGTSTDDGARLQKGSGLLREGGFDMKLELIDTQRALLRDSSVSSWFLWLKALSAACPARVMTGTTP